MSGRTFRPVSVRMSREGAANREIGRTSVSSRCAAIIVCAFSATIGVVPVWQAAADLLSTKGEGVRAIQLLQWPLGAVRTFADSGGTLWQRLSEANGWTADRIDEFETKLDDESVLSKLSIPRVQVILSSLGAGNEKAYVGREGWLFYRSDVDHLTAAGFLDPHQMQVNDRSVDPRTAISEFAKQLEHRAIDLVVVPVPSKASVHPEMFSRSFDVPDNAIVNPSYAAFIEDLRRAGVLVFDPTDQLMELKVADGSHQYLETDTHWSPGAMAAVAEKLAHFVVENVGLGVIEKRQLNLEATAVTNHGDIATMLRLSEDQEVFPAETVSLEQVVTEDGSFWRSERKAEVLVLGDSFSNIYSLRGMGWGESAGFVEHLAYNLQAPVDAILRNDAGAYSSREILSRELAKGFDRLKGKKVVVWQFAARELSYGDWKLIPMNIGSHVGRSFFVPHRGESVTVSGRVIDVSVAPRPGRVPYKDHIVALHLTDLVGADGIPIENDAFVYAWSMRDNQPTNASGYRPEDIVHLKLQPWNDVASKYERFNRSELPDESLQFEEPCWGEVVDTEL